MDTNDFYFYDYGWSGEKAPSYLPNEDEQDFDDLDQASQLEKYIQNYYYFNPDTLMPLLFLALASKDRLKVTENASPAPGAYCSYSLEEMGNQSWHVPRPYRSFSTSFPAARRSGSPSQSLSD